MLYALTSAPPHEMFRRLLNVCLKKLKDPAVVSGTYEVNEKMVNIQARQSLDTVQLELTIEHASRRFGALKLDRHLSSPTGCFEERSRDRVEYKVPNQQFQFVQAKFL